MNACIKDYMKTLKFLLCDERVYARCIERCFKISLQQERFEALVLLWGSSFITSCFLNVRVSLAIQNGLSLQSIESLLKLDVYSNKSYCKLMEASVLQKRDEVIKLVLDDRKRNKILRHRIVNGLLINYILSKQQLEVFLSDEGILDLIFKEDKSFTVFNKLLKVYAIRSLECISLLLDYAKRYNVPKDSNVIKNIWENERTLTEALNVLIEHGYEDPRPLYYKYTRKIVIGVLVAGAIAYTVNKIQIDSS